MSTRQSNINSKKKLLRGRCSLRVACFLFLSVYSLKAQVKPNFILINIDDLGWTDVGYIEKRYYSPSFYESPNIDKFAASAMVFDQGYANASNCAPSRAALISGQYAPRTGVYTVGEGDRIKSNQQKVVPVVNDTALAASHISLGEMMKSAGYATASIGKWHLSSEDPGTTPEGQGFDLNIGGYFNGSPPGGHFCPWDERAPLLNPCEQGDYLTDVLNAEGIKFIEKNKDKPFFLYLPHYAVHAVLQSKKDILEKYESKPTSAGHVNAKLAGMIESVDIGVGLILKKLDELKLTDKTVVVFTSDNGGPEGKISSPITNNAPLRAGKGTLYEGGVRVPFIIRWPGVTKPGSISQVPIMHLDLYSTFAEIAGVTLDKNYKLDGESLVPLLKGTGNLKREAIFWHFPAYLGGEGDGGGRVGIRATPNGSVRAGDYKLIEWFEYGQLELYNIVKDMSEENNLAASLPGKVAELRKMMLDWRKETNAFMPTVANKAFNIPDSEVPKNYITWEAIKDKVIWGCMISTDLAFDKLANAHDPAACQSVTIKNKPFLEGKARVEIIRTNKNLMGAGLKVQIFDAGEHNLIVMDVMGHVIYQQQGSEAKYYEVPLNGKGGLYFISVKTSQGNFFQKIFRGVE